MKEPIFKNNWLKLIKNVPNFPKPGICFKDISEIFLHPVAFQEIILEIIKIFKQYQIDVIVAPEARGFLFASVISYLTTTKFVLIRKKNKLPRKTFAIKYESEYQESELEIHQDAILKNERIFLFDDILATGQTTLAIINLLEKKFQAKIIALVYLLDLNLNAKKLLQKYPLYILANNNR